MFKLFPQFLIICSFFLLSCSSSKSIGKSYNYFQYDLDSLHRVIYKEPLIQPSDLLSIQVFSKSVNQEQTVIFNIANGGSGSSTGYLVGMDGTVELPFVGSVQVAGLTRKQLSAFLAGKLSPYVKDPSVLVRFLQFRVNVVGEVKAPGTYSFQTDRVTLMDALSAAGDLTAFATRMDITVIREENGYRTLYPVDITSGKFFQSPGYQLRQNDIVFVKANKNKLSEVKTSATAQRNIQLVLTIASFVALVVNLITTLSR